MTIPDPIMCPVCGHDAKKHSRHWEGNTPLNCYECIVIQDCIISTPERVAYLAGVAAEREQAKRLVEALERMVEHTAHEAGCSGGLDDAYRCKCGMREDLPFARAALADYEKGLAE